MMIKKKCEGYSQYQGHLMLLFNSSQASVILSYNFCVYDIQGFQTELVKDVNLSFIG